MFKRQRSIEFFTMLNINLIIGINNISTCSLPPFTRFLRNSQWFHSRIIQRFRFILKIIFTITRFIILILIVCDFCLLKTEK